MTPDAAALLLPFRSLAHNNAWANHRLLAACAALPQSEWTAPRTGFFPSLRATLNHILVIDRFYVDAMEGGTLGPAAWTDPEPCADVAALTAAQAEVDRRLIAVVDSLDGGAGLARIVSVHRGEDRVQRERMDRLLLHLFQHDIHHRGQAHAMLSGTPVAPPQLDEFFSAGEASLRVDEFRTLGFTEERIWGESLRPAARPPRFTAPCTAMDAAVPPMSEHQKQCGRRLRKLIDVLGLQQTQAAVDMGVTKQRLNNWLAGGSYPEMYALYRFARLRHLDLFDYVFLGNWSSLPAKVAERLHAEALSKLEAEKAENG